MVGRNVQPMIATTEIVATECNERQDPGASLTQNSVQLKLDGTLIIPPSHSSAVSWSSRALYRAARTAFLPAGFPQSVTSDYLGYQAWDTVQALSSYVRGMLTSQALLLGAGVGSQAATAASVVVQFFFRDAIGLLGGVIFAAMQGSSFDSHAKQWRLLADIANDVGLTIELAAPLYPSAFLAMACVGSLCRSITGVAGGATRMALTQHFALQNNSADIASKEGSQETAVTLIGMVLGLALVRLGTSRQGAAWGAFWLLTAVHVVANIRALRCLNLTRINRTRLDLLLSHFVRSGGLVLKPEEVASLESFIPPPIERAFKMVGLLKRGQVKLAPSLHSLSPHARHLVAQALSHNKRDLKAPRSLKPEKYCIVPLESERCIVAVISGAANAGDDLLEAYCVARLEMWKMNGYVDDANNKIPRTPAVNPEAWTEHSQLFLTAVRRAGWSCDQPALLQGHSRLHWEAPRVFQKNEKML